MASIVDPDIDLYLRNLYHGSDPVRLEMEEVAKIRNFPIVGPLVGRSLAVLARAACSSWARATAGPRCTPPAGRTRRRGPLHRARRGQRVRGRALPHAGDVWSCVTYHCEEATAALRRVGGTWDIVYNDIDKSRYPETVNLADAHLRPGGLFITDNVLWSDRVLTGQDDRTADKADLEKGWRP